SEHPNYGFAGKTRTRAVHHLDPTDETALTSQVERQLLSISDQAVNPKILAKAVLIDEPDRHHVNVVAPCLEIQRPEPAGPVPIVRLANLDDIAIDAEAHSLLAEQLPFEAVPSSPVVVEVAPLRIGIGPHQPGEHQRTRQCGHHLSQLHHNLPNPGAEHRPRTIRQHSAVIAARTWPM